MVKSDLHFEIALNMNVACQTKTGHIDWEKDSKINNNTSRQPKETHSHKLPENK